VPRLILSVVYRTNPPWTLPEEYIEDIRRAAGDAFEVYQAASDEEVAARLGETQIMYGWHLTPQDVARAPKLRWAQATSAGVDGMLFPELVDRGIILTSAVGIHAIEISEQAMGTMVALTRQFPKFMRQQIEGVWLRSVTSEEMGELYEKTLAIIGLGHIGEALAVRAKAFGMRVLGIRRTPAGYRGVADEVAAANRMGDVVSRADYVVALLPQTPETDKAISAEVIARMKPTAYFLNFGRGSAVDQMALEMALSTGKIAGAGLDVFAEEPLPIDSPLWRMENVIITPHVSGMTPRYWERATELFCENLRRYMRGEKLLNVVTRETGY